MKDLQASPPVILSIAGYDPSSGAGVTADIKTAAAFGCYAVTCITALTVQTTQGVFDVEPVRPGDRPRDVEPAAAGLRDCRRLHRNARLGAVATRWPASWNGNGFPMWCWIRCSGRVREPTSSTPQGLEVLRKQLLPLADLVTPNTEEAAHPGRGRTRLPPSEARGNRLNLDIRELAAQLHALGARGVLITGGASGRTSGLSQHSAARRRPLGARFPGKHLDSRSTHGTGCALATALACLLASGTGPVAAVAEAKEYVRQAILQADPLGKGLGPVKHLHRR